MISILRHVEPVWYRVQVHRQREDCTLALPVRANSLQEAREQVLDRYRHCDGVEVTLVERRRRLG